MTGLKRMRRSGAAAVLAITLAGAPAAAQLSEPAQPAPAAREAAQRLAPRDIAAGAQAALLVIYALSADGDTLGSGTGFAVSRDGLFVTNFHVIEPAEALRVETLEGHAYADVSLVAADAPHDLAVLRVSGGQLRPLALGRDDDAQVGDDVYVMGNPMGMNGTFTDGMVSGRRPVEGVSMLQMSAPISPGSSGGPVMNARGEVIGVATLILAGGQNINLAVPVRYLRPLLATRQPGRPFTAAALPRAEATGLAALREPGRGRAPTRRGSRLTPEQQVRMQMDAFGEWVRGRGFGPAGPAWTGSLPRGQGAERMVQLEAGREYVLTARCDMQCSDVDLALFDAAGNRVMADVEDDDYPTLVVRPERGGTFRLVTVMAACTAPACTYGANVYQK